MIRKMKIKKVNMKMMMTVNKLKKENQNLNGVNRYQKKHMSY